MQLELVTARTVEPQADDRVFRVAVVGRIVGLTAVASVTVACGWGGFGVGGGGSGGSGISSLPSAIVWWCAAWLGLFALLLANDVRKVLRPESWLVIAGPRGVLVKWRSYQNVDVGSDEPDSVRIPHRCIALARIVDREWVTPGSRGSSRSTRRRFVELTLTSVDTTELEHALALDREGRSRSGAQRKVRWNHHPVTLEPGAILRIEWDARGKPEDLLDALREFGVSIGAATASKTELVKVGSDDELREVARRGDVMTLIAVLRRTRGLDLTSAHARARELIAAEHDSPR